MLSVIPSVSEGSGGEGGARFEAAVLEASAAHRPSTRSLALARDDIVVTGQGSAFVVITDHCHGCGDHSVISCDAMKENRWLAVPLDAYEGHMALPYVAQAPLIGDVLAKLLERFQPESVVVAGCAGGNGFERIDPAHVKRVVGIDVNGAYLDAAQRRFASRFESLQLVCADVERDELPVEPVDLLYAALLLEYTSPAAALARLFALAAGRGVVAILSQMPNAAIPEITPSPYAASVDALAECFRFIDIDALASAAAALGWREIGRTPFRSAGGKEFQLQLFQRSET